MRYVNDLATIRKLNLPNGWQNNIDTSVRSAVNDGSLILALFTKRIAKVLLRGLGNKPIAGVKSFNSFTKFQSKTLQTIVNKTKQIMDHHIKVHTLIYQMSF
jgi:hypothetical protein